MLDIAADKADAAYREVLKPAQVIRLEQVVLQIKGPLAVAEPAVAEAILLEPDQLQQVQQIRERMRAGQQPVGAIPIGARPAGLRAPRPGGTEAASSDNGGQTQVGAPAVTQAAPPAPPAAKKVATDDDEDGAPLPPKSTTPVAKDAPTKAPRRAPATPEQTARFRPAARRSPKIMRRLREKAIQEVSKVLTSSQRNAFNRMLGKRIPDLSTLLSERAMALGVAPGYNATAPALRKAATPGSGGAGARPAAPAKKN